jgi:hypothetical protein
VAARPAVEGPDELLDWLARDGPEIEYVRGQLLGELRAWGPAFAMEGGLLSYQVCPYHPAFDFEYWSPDNARAMLRHELGLLGMLTVPAPELWDAIQEWISYKNGPTVLTGRAPHRVHIDWTLAPADDPRALRMLLAGSSSSYQLHRIPDSCTTDDLQERKSPAGVPGVFALQPLFLADPWRWWAAALLTKGKPLFLPFGSWRSGLTAAKEAEQKRSLPAGRRDPRKDRVALSQVNKVRSQEAEARRCRLLTLARRLWPRVAAGAAGQVGRPAHRRRLGELLAAEIGVRPSERDLRWLLRSLHMDGGLAEDLSGK